MFLDLLKPDFYFPRFEDIDFQMLVKESGIEYLIIDLDNTIVLRSQSFQLSLHVIAAFHRARSAGIKDMCLVSNIGIPRSCLFFGTDMAKRVKDYTLQLGINHYLALTWPNIKPKPVVFYQAMVMMSSNFNNTAVIGDQIYTDIKGGNSTGCLTVLVKPLGGHHPITYLFKGRKEKEAWDQLLQLGIVK